MEIVHQLIVTDFTVSIYECLDCGEEVRATLPDGREPCSYGPQLQADIVLDKAEGRLPYRKIEERLERMGVPSCPATLQAVVWEASRKLEVEQAAILERIRVALVVYADETTFPVDGHRWYLWSFSTPREVYLLMRRSRGENVVRVVLGEGSEGR